MVKTVSFINIRELLSRLLRHPLLQDVTLEQVVQHTIDFISIVGMPKFYLDKEQTIEIKEYRGLLPCDLISINQVKVESQHLKSCCYLFTFGILNTFIPY